MSRIKALSVVVLSGGILLFCLYQLSQLDFQTVLLVRSLHDPFVARLATVGNRLGDGLTLVLLCIGLWGIGYLWKHKVWQQAGIDGLVAHALAGLAVQILKHLIGRPRPRWTHQQAFEFGPSWQGGLDAFPSGHAAASFTVAAVLARYFPEWKGLWYGAALFVGAARVVGGSHFPTDVLGGAVMGFPDRLRVGARAQGLARERGASVAEDSPVDDRRVRVVLDHLQSSGLRWINGSLFWTGLLLLVAGLGARWIMAWQGDGNAERTLGANIVIAMGLATTSQTLWVVVVTLLACLAWWLNHQPESRVPRGFLREAALTSALVIVLVCYRVSTAYRRGLIGLLLGQLHRTAQGW